MWDRKYIRNNLNEVIGIDLGWYACNEHERGIEELKRQFGVDETGKINKIPRNVFVGNTPISFTSRVSENGDLIQFNHLVYDFRMGRVSEYKNWRVGHVETRVEEKQKYLRNRLYSFASANDYPKFSKNYLLTAWDDSAFFVLDKGNDDFFKRLEDAFLHENVNIGFGPESNGLVIAIHSELSKLN